jgi:hypothetical protein
MTCDSSSSPWACGRGCGHLRGARGQQRRCFVCVKAGGLALVGCGPPDLESYGITPPPLLLPGWATSPSHQLLAQANLGRACGTGHWPGGCCMGCRLGAALPPAGCSPRQGAGARAAVRLKSGEGGARRAARPPRLARMRSPWTNAPTWPLAPALEQRAQPILVSGTGSFGSAGPAHPGGSRPRARTSLRQRRCLRTADADEACACA